MIQLRAAVKDQQPERLLSSIEELDSTLDDADREARQVGRLNIVILGAPNRDWLGLVLGGDETVVSYNFGHGDPPYFVSRGSADSDDPVLTAYVGLEHHTEFPRRWVVPASTGRRAARDFLATGKRPTSLQWTEA
jgi:hypothetical protein